MHVALLCPFSHGPARGNLTTVDRIFRNLQAAGHQVSLLPLDAADLAQRRMQLTLNPPDLFHAFHAYHTGPLARELASEFRVPYLITLTGSDLFDPALRDHPLTQSAVAQAACITCFDQLVAGQAAAAFQVAEGRLRVIPQGVEPFFGATPLSKVSDAFVVLLPAALRPVKGVDDAIAQLAPLAASEPRLNLWVAGGALDQIYAEQLLQMTAGQPWISLLGEIPRQRMGDYYLTADLVLNSSWFEGGMANALLEAMVMGKPLLARDIAGNRSLVQDQKTGWLYRDGDEMRHLLTMIMEQPAQRLLVGQAAQQRAQNVYSPAREVKALVELYRQLCR